MMKVAIDPILIDLGPFRLSWYGLMYVFGFVAAYLLVRYQMKRKDFGVSKPEVEDLFFYIIIGLIVGARLGYVLFYDLKMYIADPLEAFAIWHGGMSFHGGLIGVLLVGVLFCWKRKKSFWKIADLFIVTAPLGLGLGRIGNFINGELYGRVTQVPWGMIFPRGGPLPRHPSQLYESALEGGVLFLILWLIRDSKKIRTGGLLALFLSIYGVFRFFVEFFREPDSQLGFVLGPFSMGQVLCAFMIVTGVVLYIYLSKKPETSTKSRK
ncbi:MAG: prolipoprotein diacylglyceryl transferase [Deltaproteobacteria bacterium RBG_13_53_10]|nr:MAG: prolipoprotein diacylglyceryl transferase [Deltaproteobacteria bacterium RBG_13_53_10]